jgi:hypothetical protein
MNNRGIFDLIWLKFWFQKNLRKIVFEISFLAWIRNWIRIRIEQKCWIRIRNKSIRIHNPALSFKRLVSGDPHKHWSGDPHKHWSGDPHKHCSGDPRNHCSGDPRNHCSGDPRNHCSGDPRNHCSGDPRNHCSGDPRKHWSGDPQKHFSLTMGGTIRI